MHVALLGNGMTLAMLVLVSAQPRLSCLRARSSLWPLSSASLPPRRARSSTSGTLVGSRRPAPTSGHSAVSRGAIACDVMCERLLQRALQTLCVSAQCTFCILLLPIHSTVQWVPGGLSFSCFLVLADQEVFRFWQPEARSLTWMPGRCEAPMKTLLPASLPLTAPAAQSQLHHEQVVGHVPAL
eukprot:scaffold102766_cov18-Tisochrysis_lutea.AAC.2